MHKFSNNHRSHALYQGTALALAVPYIAEGIGALQVSEQLNVFEGYDLQVVHKRLQIGAALAAEGAPLSGNFSAACLAEPYREEG
jgi:hypothetical protein